MKRIRLLLAAVAAMVGLSVNAQTWTPPTIQGETPVSGASYKVYNVGAGKFLNGGKAWFSWSTTAILSDYALQVTFTGSESSFTLKRSDGKFVFTSGNGIAGDAMHVDGANATNYGLTLLPSGNYRIHDAGGNESSSCWGFNSSFHASGIVAHADATADGWNCEWAFLGSNSYAMYEARLALYNSYLAATAENVSTTDAAVVYNNESATLDQITAATTALNQARLEQKLKIASNSNPQDITEFVLVNSNFSSGNINGWETNYVSGKQAQNIGYQSNNNYTNGDAFLNQFIEAWLPASSSIGNGYLRQTVSGMPEGKYVLEADAIATNQNNANATTVGAYLYINADGLDFKTSLSTNGGVPQHFSTEFLFSGEGDVIFGLKTESTTANWIAADNFKVTFYGIDLSAYESQLATAVAEFEALNGTVPATIYATKKSSIVDINNKEWSSSKEYIAAIAAVQTATNDLKELVSDYARYKSIRDAVIAVSSSVDVSTANDEADNATTKDQLISAVATVRNALTSYLASVELSAGQTFDLTDALIDNAAPGISGKTDYWTNSETPALQYQLYEYWNKAGASTKQTITTTLPAGNYKLTAIAYTRDNYASTLNAGSNSVNLVGCGSINDRRGGDEWIASGNGVNTLLFNLSEATSNLEIGITADNANGDHWTCWRSFRLIYGDVFDAYTLVEGKMNVDVAKAQTDADNEYQSNPNPTTYMAVLNAIAAAQASKNAYVPFTAAINKIDAALEAATTATASTEEYETIKKAYTDATVADAEISTAIANAYNSVIPVIKSQTAENADFTLAIQNQSFEYGDMTGWTAPASNDTGVRSNANPTYATAGSDGDYLFNTWSMGVPLTQTVSKLPNGQYTLTASVASDGATIYLLANGEHNDGTETYAETNVEENQYSKDTFQDATITFLVKDGIATIGVVGGEGGEAGVHKNYVAEGYWWYKADNFRLVKVRDLTEEEAAVVPTAIKLFNGEEEVTEAITLDKENTSVTLVAQYEPEDATEGLTWSTTDASVATVADGVVTAVTSGTVTITAASTLDENVKATATVVVAFPETTVPEYINDGATRYILSGENIIKNGTFQYNNPFQGWKSGANGNCDSNNFNIVTDGDNKYIQGKENKGGNDPHSIRTAWPIEPGKTYMFGYKVKSNAAGNSGYHVVSMTNTVGTETEKVSVDATPVTTSWTDVNYKFTNPAENGYAYVQFAARWLANNTSFDEFYLTEVTDIVGNTQYALDALPTANIGEKAFQYSQTEIFSSGINNLEQGTSTPEDVQAVHDKLAALELIAPADGQLFNVILTYAGWTYDNKAMTYLANGRTDAGLYNIQYKEAANKNLAQAFTFTKVEGNNYKMSQIDANGVARYISTGVPYGGKTDQIRTTTNADEALVVTVIPTATEGVWNLKNTAANQFIGSQDAGVFTVNSHIDFQLVETTKPEITINTTAAGYGTTMLPFAVAELPEGVKVYTCAGTEGDVLTLATADAIEANKPYIIEGTWEAVLTGDAQGINLTTTEGLLTGVYAETAAPVGSFVLQKNNDKVGFYRVADGGQPTVRANHAYLTEEAGARAAYFFGEGVTNGINAIEALTEGNVGIFNAAGVQQPRLQKGLNIVKKADGTSFKVMVK